MLDFAKRHGWIVGVRGRFTRSKIAVAAPYVLVALLAVLLWGAWWLAERGPENGTSTSDKNDNSYATDYKDLGKSELTRRFIRRDRLREAVESRLEAKVLSSLGKAFGRDHVVVQVGVSLDGDRVSPALRSAESESAPRPTPRDVLGLFGRADDAAAPVAPRPRAEAAELSSNLRVNRVKISVFIDRGVLEGGADTTASRTETVDELEEMVMNMIGRTEGVSVKVMCLPFSAVSTQDGGASGLPQIASDLACWIAVALIAVLVAVFCWFGLSRGASLGGGRSHVSNHDRCDRGEEDRGFEQEAGASLETQIHQIVEENPELASRVLRQWVEENH